MKKLMVFLMTALLLSLFVTSAAFAQEEQPDPSFYKSIFHDDVYDVFSSNFHVLADGTIIATTTYRKMIENKWFSDDSRGSSLIALGADHRLMWEKQIARQVPPYPSILAISSEQKMIYVLSKPKNVYAYDFYGNKLWEYASETFDFLNAVTDPDGNVYLSQKTNNDLECGITALSSSGEMMWEHKVRISNHRADGILIGVRFSPDGALLFQSSEKLYAYNLDGTIKWTFESNGFPKHFGADGTIYLIPGARYPSEATLYAVDPANGDVKWKYNAADYNEIYQYDVTPDGTVYLIANKRHIQRSEADGSWKIDNKSALIALDSYGNEKWSFRPQKKLTGFHLYPDHALYLFSGDTVHSLALDGTENWKINLPDYDVINGIHIGENGSIFVHVFSSKASTYTSKVLEYSVEGKLLNKYQGELGEKMADGNSYVVDRNSINLSVVPLAD